MGDEVQKNRRLVDKADQSQASKFKRAGSSDNNRPSSPPAAKQGAPN